MTPEYDEEYRRRQRARAVVTAWALVGLVILFFAISLVRMH
jgi:hypothetical protein